MRTARQIPAIAANHQTDDTWRDWKTLRIPPHGSTALRRTLIFIYTGISQNGGTPFILQIE